ncbi:hypothetical protein ABL78_5568 [Leptomonas seymouri]|uniref:Uncharacterized protein n=1 Tax=Leptomonas seymouri TaxID=5684 RepID=A0A0N0P4Z0_LEPSE|nr:hypothetical protein ABL78_5568 [Leptomonas seymouri]|eukprot:KPI85387.1 hypothetical protein ABL78_5568 [Leptomonas seymouri]
MLQTATNNYALPLKGGRAVPYHGYSLISLARTRMHENTSALAITVGLLLPAMNDVNKHLDKHVAAGTDVSTEELVEIFAKSGRRAAVMYADRLARIACQTGLACVYIKSKSSFGNSAVYLWDLYPRLHQRYLSAVLRVVHAPIFLSGLLGRGPNVQDVAFLETPASGVCAFTDSLRRDSITLFGDITMDTVRIALRKDVERPIEAIANQVALRVTVTLTGAVGAGVGRTVGGERGEYWGNIAGVLAGPLVAAQVLVAMGKFKLIRSRRSSSPTVRASGEAARAHRHRRTSSKESKPSGVETAATA